MIGDVVNKIGETVSLSGWISTRRDHGKIMFLDLRDRTGLVQIVSNKSLADTKPEDCVEITGVVKKRPEAMINTKIATGTVEIEAQTITILSKATELPFPLDTDGRDINEEIKLKYRYLDLRRDRMQKNIRLRSKVVDLIRQYLFKNEFTEIETPLLTKSTPEGSRDFLVPSRMQPGNFYALPQSPQQYKQLLMVAGFERYFQIARCLRDEDLRADRGFEHTQLDLEMSFVEREDVMNIIEEMVTSVVEILGGTIKQKPFPVISYKDAIAKYGADKFDLRSEEEKKKGIHAFAWVVDFPFFEKDKEGKWTYSHNPFSDPKQEHKDAFLKGQVEGILTTQYDLVWNGYEAGGGSIRSTDPAILTKVFETIGHTKEQIEKQFGHMERFLMCLTGETSIKDVQAFPQTSSGQTSVMDAPSAVSDEQLMELGITLRKRVKQTSVFKDITTLLDESHIIYKTYQHEAVFTSQDAAKVRNTNMHQGAKALIMYADGNPIMVVVPGDMKVDTKGFKELYQVRDLRMATSEEVEQVTCVLIGAVPPFGNIFQIPLYVDQRLRENEEIVFNAGEHTKSIQMKETDFEKVAKPIVGEFTK
ncbi:MAG: Aspartyl-tRNA synthetase [Microgenomates group bacterium GW2011_GWB1_40_9]|nr:MAG: Aspartyl-tRNA synthetase [Microgenomates group bacterium GW2011_GWB1_40_9]